MTALADWATLVSSLGNHGPGADLAADIKSAGEAWEAVGSPTGYATPTGAYQAWESATVEALQRVFNLEAAIRGTTAQTATTARLEERWKAATVSLASAAARATDPDQLALAQALSEQRFPTPPAKYPAGSKKTVRRLRPGEGLRTDGAIVNNGGGVIVEPPTPYPPVAVPLNSRLREAELALKEAIALGDSFLAL